MTKNCLPAIVLMFAASAAGACAVDPRLDAVATAWLAHQAQQPLDDMNAVQALCFRQKLLKKLKTSLGPVVGYKVGVYTATARKTYGTSAPEVGVLLKGMLLHAGVTVAASSGVATVSEADFLLVVKDGGINQAKTREEAYRHLRGYRAFVELPDLNYVPTPKPSLSQLVALNVNARAGVMGKEVPLPQTPEGFEGLSQLTADVTVEGAAEGMLHAHGVARETLGDPLEILLAARDGLKKEGVKLKAGDLISIGTITPPRPVKAGETLIIRYTVAPSTADISVTFVP
jgi:2-keto-4-pentenoate hydratase